jgi:hypothetical protein
MKFKCIKDYPEGRYDTPCFKTGNKYHGKRGKYFYTIYNKSENSELFIPKELLKEYFKVLKLVI